MGTWRREAAEGGAGSGSAKGLVPEEVPAEEDREEEAMEAALGFGWAEARFGSDLRDERLIPCNQE